MATTTISTTEPPARSHCATRAGDLATKRSVARAFFAHGSPRVIVAAASVALIARFIVGSWSLADVLLTAITAALVGPVEWMIHLFLLHASDDSFAMRRLGTGRGHRQHHLDPHDLDWLLLRGVDAAVYVAVIAAFTALWSLPLLLVTGSATLGPYVTALVVAFAALGHYEWTHLLVHAHYRPRSRFYARLARNHRFHHYRNERFWLGVTSNVGDRLLHTLPADKSDVPLSDTARTLR